MKRSTMYKVLESVADVFDVTVDDMLGKRRHHHLVLARTAATKILYEEFDLPLKEVSRLMRKEDRMAFHYKKLADEFIEQKSWRLRLFESKHLLTHG